MPFKFEWIDEPYIYRGEILGEFTEADLSEWADVVWDVVDSSPHMIYGMIVVSPDIKMKANALKNTKIRDIMSHPRLAMTVVVGITPVIGFLMQSFQKITGMRMKTAPTFEEGADFLRQLRLIEEEQRQRKLKTGETPQQG
jgi:hypothetical protein